jgi:hypothetical protein
MTMAQKLWFKRKSYGWGWTPASIEGWMAILLYAIAVSVYPVLKANGDDFSFFIFTAITLFFTGVLIVICVRKGEKPRWSWGDKDNQSFKR